MAIVTTVPGIWSGSIFADKTGALYRAKKCNPANIRSIGMDGKTWNVRWEFTREATPEERERYEAWEAAEKAKQPEVDPLASLHRVGNVVRFKNPTKPQMQGLFVVTKMKADGYSLAWLGGNAENRYWPTIPGDQIENVDGSLEVKNI